MYSNQTAECQFCIDFIFQKDIIRVPWGYIGYMKLKYKYSTVCSFCKYGISSPQCELPVILCISRPCNFISTPHDYGECVILVLLIFIIILCCYSIVYAWLSERFHKLISNFIIFSYCVLGIYHSIKNMFCLCLSVLHCTAASLWQKRVWEFQHTLWEIQMYKSWMWVHSKYIAE